MIQVGQLHVIGTAVGVGLVSDRSALARFEAFPRPRWRRWRVLEGLKAVIIGVGRVPPDLGVVSATQILQRALGSECSCAGIVGDEFHRAGSEKLRIVPRESDVLISDPSPLPAIGQLPRWEDRWPA